MFLADLGTMILRLSPRFRGILIIIAFLCVSGLSFFSIRTAWATHERELGTIAGFERAVRMEPDNARNWFSLGRYLQYDLGHQDSEQAIQKYQKALALDPNSANILLELAIAYDLKEDSKNARETYIRAKSAYPASPDASWSYGNFLVRHGEYASAYQEIRHAVLVDPSRTAAAFSLFYHVNPNADFILTQVLPASEIGYKGLVGALAATHTDIAMTVWTKLIAISPRLGPEDVYPLVDALMARREYVEARLVWDQGFGLTDIPHGITSQGSVLWDGGFESGYNGRRFAWYFEPLYKGVHTSIDSQERHSGNRSLKLNFNGELNVYFSNACTDAVVEPGSMYHFSGWIRTNGLTSDHGVGFGLREPGSDFLKTLNVRGTKSWTLVETQWRAPDNGHLVQICIMRDPSETEGDRIRGTAWVDDVSLTPL